MATTIHTGDCRDVLRSMPDASVHCVVTSPPYYGLRDYGVAGQMGLEATPDAYIAGMVEVFREVKRVLRDDGTLWLNLGSSYASGASRPSRFQADVPACGSDDTEPPGSPAADCAYPGRDDECLDGSPNHHGRTSDIGLPTSPAMRPDETIARDSEHQASIAEAPSLLAALVSTSQASPANAPDACGHEAMASACPTGSPIDALDAPASSRMEECRNDTALRASVDRRKGKDVSGLACDCGSCGLCFARLATASLRFKPKDLMMLPELLAMALQADGWYLRSSIIWAKPNPMPESVTDRPTSAHEHVFLLTKAARYFFDAQAIAEPLAGEPHAPGNLATGRLMGDNCVRQSDRVWGMNGTRSCRNVWSIATEAFPLAHFATYPTALAERCIKAGTSERGCCAACGAPWVRMQERTAPDGRSVVVPAGQRHAYSEGGEPLMPDNRIDIGTRASFNAASGVLQRTTTGWRASCQCDAPTVPCRVLDPFGGSGTTAMVADRLQRDAVLIELSPAYAAMARNRLVRDAGLFAEVAD